ncbi:ER membrane protein complex subunit 3 [Lepeophtheirus salmonis]|uniref:ER membrane protein complex subunit 3 n=1 Tax=Lepeophtheirus salmonis TaxID=72036 RepID=UPI001AEAF27C|nr:ER membrane protein complex subunit 3-like [Lepeophtheirus salmonis]
MMTDPELRLDPAIRNWVFIPIVLIAFFIGIIRHYVSILLSSSKKVDLNQVRESQILLRSRSIRENAKYLPKHSFLMRRHFFNNAESGVLKTNTPKTAPPNPMMDPSMMTDMLKGNITNMLPMIVIGGWINWHFSGFVTTKIPFPLTLRFKPMLQRGIELMSLDASWVSSASWYFLNVFGLRSIYDLVLGENNVADQSRIMQDQMMMPANGMATDYKQAFKGEWEALEITEHAWAIKNAEQEMISAFERRKAEGTLYL